MTRVDREAHAARLKHLQENDVVEQQRHLLFTHCVARIDFVGGTCLQKHMHVHFRAILQDITEFFIQITPGGAGIHS